FGAGHRGFGPWAPAGLTADLGAAAPLAPLGSRAPRLESSNPDGSSPASSAGAAGAAPRSGEAAPAPSEAAPNEVVPSARRRRARRPQPNPEDPGYADHPEVVPLRAEREHRRRHHHAQPARAPQRADVRGLRGAA